MRFSVVIPASKPMWLHLTLSAILHQSWPSSGYELVIVDDSGGNIKPVLAEFESRLANRPMKYISHESRLGRSHARNVGISKSEGEIVVFLDDDMIPSPDFLEAHDRYHLEGFSVVTPGNPYRALTIWYENWFGSLSHNEREKITEDGSPALKKYINYQPESASTHTQRILQVDDLLYDFKRLDDLTVTLQNPMFASFGDDLTNCNVPWTHCASCNMSVRRDLLESTTGFDENFQGWGGEDLELAYRLHLAHARFAVGSQAIAIHQFHFRDWHKNYLEGQRNYKYFCQKHPDIAVYLYFQYRTKRQLNIQEYNEIVKRDQLGQMTPSELLTIKQTYEQFASMDGESLPQEDFESFVRGRHSKT